jgi:hypothetical protein
MGCIELRLIEVIIQQRVAVEEIDESEKKVLAQIQKILYDTAVRALTCLECSQLIMRFRMASRSVHLLYDVE